MIECLFKDASFSHNVLLPYFLYNNSEGEYGVGAGHMPYVAQLKPGVLQILHEEGTSEPEKYFVAGGLAMTHPDSSTVSTGVAFTWLVYLGDGKQKKLLNLVSHAIVPLQ